MKKQWNSPELLILTKRRSDEVILALCKEGSGGPETTFMECTVICDSCMQS